MKRAPPTRRHGESDHMPRFPCTDPPRPAGFGLRDTVLAPPSPPEADGQDHIRSVNMPGPRVYTIAEVKELVPRLITTFEKVEAIKKKLRMANIRANAL